MFSKKVPLKFRLPVTDRFPAKVEVAVPEVVVRYGTDSAPDTV